MITDFSWSNDQEYFKFESLICRLFDRYEKVKLRPFEWFLFDLKISNIRGLTQIRSGWELAQKRTPQ